MKKEFDIIGHRGNRDDFRENTIEGLKSVLGNNGISGIEIDITVTKDKKIILSHDLFLKENSNKHLIYEHTYKELLEISERIDIDSPNKGKRYPLLDDVLKVFSKKSINQKLFIEIKSLPSNNFSMTINEIINYLHSLIKKYRIENTCYIISFDYRFIHESYLLDNKIKIGMILHRNIIPLDILIHNIKLSILVLEKDWIINEYIKQAKKYNIDIYAWTPNLKKDWIRLINLGVKGLITDVPKKMLQYKKIME